MLASLALLNEFVTLPLRPSARPQLAQLAPGIACDAELIEALLTRQGFEVEGRTQRGEGLDGVVVGRVTEARPHPQADRLQICQVDAGGGVVHQIVCGAPNARPGLFVAVALPGTQLPGGIDIAAATIRGVASHGMLCSRAELGLPVLAVDGDGIWELDRDASCGRSARDLEPLIGEPVFHALGLADVILDLSVTPNRPDALCHLGLAREIFVGLRSAGIKTTWHGTAWLHRRAKEHIPPADLIHRAGQARLQTSADLRLTFSDGALVCCANALGVTAFFMGYEGLLARPSPGWLRRTLETIGQNSINDIVDLSNLVLHTVGQPSHAFDFDRLGSGQTQVHLTLRKAKPGEDFVGLDGKSRQLHGDDCVVARSIQGSPGSAPETDRPEALLGLLGGDLSKVTDGTKRIVVEWANPDPVAVRRSSRRIGRKTDSGFQFEKGLDRAGRLHAAKLFGDLLTSLQPEARLVGLSGWPDDSSTLAEGFDLLPGDEVTNNSTSARSDCRPIEDRPKIPLCPWSRTSLAAIVGTAAGGLPLLDWNGQLNILSDLGFRFFASGEGATASPSMVELPVSAAVESTSLQVQAPHWRRFDVSGEADIAEEVARVVGIDAVEGVPMVLPLDARPDDGHLAFLEDAAAGMAHLGYTEVTSFHFMRDDDWSRLGMQCPAALGAPIRMVNPIILDEPLLQTTLLPDMLRKAASNTNHGTEQGLLFHISRTFQNLDRAGNLVFETGPEAGDTSSTEVPSWRNTAYDPAEALATSSEPGADARPTETPRLGLVMFGPQSARSWMRRPATEWQLHDLLGHIRDLAARLGCSVQFERLTDNHPWFPVLHPGQSVRVQVTRPDGSTLDCGWLGRLHPRALRAFSIESDVLGGELNLATLYRAKLSVKERQLPFFRPHRLPAVRRDFAIVVPRSVTAAAVEAAVRRSCDSALAEDIAIRGVAEPSCRLGEFSVFDVYTGDKIPKDTKSLGFEIVLEPTTASLSDDQIQGLSRAIVAELERDLGASLRS